RGVSLSLSNQAGTQSGGLCGTQKSTHKEFFYGAVTDRLPPTTGNPGAMATTLSGSSRITQRPVCSVLPASGDHRGAGPASTTAPRRTPARNSADAGATPDPRGAGELRASV